MTEVQKNWKWTEHFAIPVKNAIETICTCIILIAYAWFLLGAKVDLPSAISVVSKLSLAVMGVTLGLEIYSALQSRTFKVIIILVNVLHLATSVMASIAIITTWW